MPREMVSFRDACAFMDNVLPADTPPGPRRTQQVRFYAWLCGHRGQEYGIITVCPFCRHKRGICRCPQLGEPSKGDPEKWSYLLDAAFALQWLIDPRSLDGHRTTAQ